MRSKLVFVLAAALLVPLSTHSAFARTTQPDLRDTTTANTDLSAQKKKKKVVHQQYRTNSFGYRYSTDSRSPYYLRPGVAPSFGYIGPPGYAGEYAWRRSIGQCVEDLGYGRWAACGSR